MTESLKVQLDLSGYQTNLTLIGQTPADFQNDIIWRDEISLKINFTTIDPVETKSASPDAISFQLLDEDLGDIGSPIDLLPYENPTGIFNFTFNTTDYSLKGGVDYNLKITAAKNGYTDPDPLIKSFSIKQLPTEMKVYNSTTSTEFPSYTITRYWNTKVNLTIYYIEQASQNPITGATVSYSWTYGAGQINADAPKGGGFYTFELDTGAALDVTVYTITFTATKENFSDGALAQAFQVNIINRPTTLNGEEDVSYINKKMYVEDAYNFTFDYNDTLTSSRISDADDKSYRLQKLDANGNLIEGETGVGTLTELANDTYVLDIDTENLTVGDYFIFLTFDKSNYEDKDVIIDLEIQKRIIDDTLSSNFIARKAEIVAGNDISISLELKDSTRGNIPLTGATIILVVGDDSFTFSEGDAGMYSLTFDTSNINAFFSSQTLTGQITITKENFETVTIEITMVITMDEIFPGFPLFYFLMIAVAIIAVVGSLVVSRAIRQARIPRFVKRTREMKSNIQGRKGISESLMYPSKNEAIVKLLGDKWEELGIDLGDILGIDRTKGTKAPGSKGSIEKTDGGVIE